MHWWRDYGLFLAIMAALCLPTGDTAAQSNPFRPSAPQAARPARPAQQAPQAPQIPALPRPPDWAFWVADHRTFCHVLLHRDQRDAVAFWTGACAHGVAEGPGQLSILTRGREIRIDGGLVGGALQGHVVMTWDNGDRYEGEYLNGQFHGHGVFALGAGATYSGEWRDGRPHGRGVLRSGPSSWSGTWNEGCLRDWLGLTGAMNFYARGSCI